VVEKEGTILGPRPLAKYRQNYPTVFLTSRNYMQQKYS